MNEEQVVLGLVYDLRNLEYFWSSGRFRLRLVWISRCPWFLFSRGSDRGWIWSTDIPRQQRSWPVRKVLSFVSQSVGGKFKLKNSKIAISNIWVNCRCCWISRTLSLQTWKATHPGMTQWMQTEIATWQTKMAAYMIIETKRLVNMTTLIVAEELVSQIVLKSPCYVVMIVFRSPRWQLTWPLKWSRKWWLHVRYYF